MNRILFIVCLFISQIAAAQWQPKVFHVSQKDFKEIISYSTYDESKDLYSYKFRDYNKCNIETLKKYFSKQENLTLLSCITYTEKVSTGGYNSYDVHIVRQFTFRKVNWKLDGPDAGLLVKDKKNAIGKAVQEALERGKSGNRYYTAYIPAEDPYKLKNWMKKHPQFGLIDSYESGFKFAPASEADNYLKEQEIFADVNSRIMKRVQDTWGYHYELTNVDLIIETRERYPEYKINISKYTSQTLEHFLNMYSWNITTIARFLKAFPEYPFILELAWRRNSYNLEEFLQVFDDKYPYAENQIYTELRTALAGESVPELRNTYRKGKVAVPLLKKKMDTSRITDLMNQCFAKDLKLCHTPTEQIEAYIIYTGNTYFSKTKVDDYYASAADFRTLTSELKKCTTLLQVNPGIENDMYDNYFARRFENGINEWKKLSTDFPDQKNRIMVYTRRFIDRPGSYSQQKWTQDIHRNIQNVDKTISSLNTYINAGIPDNEGLQLAKKHLSDAYATQQKYRADLPKAETYESTIKTRIRRIAKEVRETRIVPTYEVKSRKRYNEYSEEVNLSIKLDKYSPFEQTIYYDYDEKVYYNTILGSISKSDQVRSLDRYILMYAQEARYVILWDTDLEKPDKLQRAEKIIRQYDEHGINRWWRIEY